MCPTPAAKAGIRFTGGDRAALLASYARALEPYRDVFLTGPDVGTSAADFLAAGEDPVPLWARSHDGLGMDDLALEHGVKAAADAALAHLGRRLEGAAVAVEGFGKVGAGTARACARAGALVAAVSTVDGLLADPGRARCRGAAGAARASWRPARGARTAAGALARGAIRARLRRARARRAADSIPVRDGRAAQLRGRRARGEHPYGAGAVEVLYRRGILAGPDFVSNSGATYLYDVIDQDAEPQAALAAIEAGVRETIARTLATADTLAITPSAAALRETRAYLAQMTGAPGEVLDELLAA